MKVIVHCIGKIHSVQHDQKYQKPYSYSSPVIHPVLFYLSLKINVQTIFKLTLCEFNILTLGDLSELLCVVIYATLSGDILYIYLLKYVTQSIFYAVITVISTKFLYLVVIDHY